MDVNQSDRTGTKSAFNYQNQNQMLQSATILGPFRHWPIAFLLLLLLGAGSITLQAQGIDSVKLSTDSRLGKILTNGAGRSLYFFTRDAKPDTSACTGGCLNNWPIFYARNLRVGVGLDTADFKTIDRGNGVLQTTYKGWPLYYYVNDVMPGTTLGEGVGGIWFVAKPDYTVMLINNQLRGANGTNYTGSYQPGTGAVQYFVNSRGRAIYTFSRDKFRTNTFTNSTFGNNGTWPIVELTPEAFPSTLDKSLFGTIQVFGRTQLTYKGWPLYYFGQDGNVRGSNKGVSVPTPGIWPVAIKDLAEAPMVSAVNEAFAGKVALAIAPNPVNEATTIWLDLTNAASVRVVLFDLTGRQLQQLNFAGQVGRNESSLQLGNLAPGTYVVAFWLDGLLAAQERILKN